MKLRFTRNPKKSGGHLRTDRRPVTVYRFMREHRREYTVREMAGIFGVGSSAYYRWEKYGTSGRRKEGDAEPADLIRRIQERHHYRYGSPRVREELRREYGKRVSRKKVAAPGEAEVLLHDRLEPRISGLRQRVEP